MNFTRILYRNQSWSVRIRTEIRLTEFGRDFGTNIFFEYYTANYQAVFTPPNFFVKNY